MIFIPINITPLEISKIYLYSNIFGLHLLLIIYNLQESLDSTILFRLFSLASALNCVCLMHMDNCLYSKPSLSKGSLPPKSLQRDVVPPVRIFGLQQYLHHFAMSHQAETCLVMQAKEFKMTVFIFCIPVFLTCGETSD